MVIPQWRAGCIRVTHPCAGRRQIKQALSPMPLDLHVLGLSLAFILSQDQTLRCYYVISTFVLIILARYAYRNLLSPKVYTLKIINQGLQPTEIGFRSKVLSFSLCFLFPVYRKHFNVLTLLLGCSPSLRLFLKSECKINTFFWITKTFTLK